MITTAGPVHEQEAHQQAMRGDTATATVYAILALAAAVNRLTDAQQSGLRSPYPEVRIPAPARRLGIRR